MTKKLLILIVVVIATFVSVRATPIIGTVKNSKGEPVSGVFISNPPVFTFDSRFATETDQNGKFVIDINIGNDEFSELPAFKSLSEVKNERVVLFLHSKYKPTVKVITSDTKRLDVVLNEEKPSDVWQIPTCDKNSKQQRIGTHLQIPIPANFELRLPPIKEHSEFRLAYKVNSDRILWIDGASGTNTTSGFPAQFTNLREFTLRTWQNGTNKGVEVKGITNDGKYRRYLGWYNEYVSYGFAGTKDAKQAAILDEVIEKVCFQP